MKIGFLTYGCRSNRWETERIRQSLLGGGLDESCGDDADAVVINSCTVTGKIDRDILRRIKQLKKGNKKVILTGCMAERTDQGSAELKKYADLIIPNSKKFSVSSYGFTGLLPAAGPREDAVLRQFSGRDKAFVKIEEGCDNFCAYCEVPYVRGSLIRSRAAAEIKEEIGALSGAGYREIVLTGINLGYYGREKKESGALAGLLAELLKVRGDFRLRLSSIGPGEADPELIDLMAVSGGRICPHLHLSLQSGDEKVLKAMNRNYTLKEYKEKLDHAVSRVPGMAITTDIIAGFPGETGEEHKNTCGFLSENGFTRLHVFPYSDRPDTKASKMKGKISEVIKKQRVKELIAIGKKKEKEFAEKNIGVKRTALAEGGVKNGFMTGYTENYIKVVFKAGGDMAGRFVTVVVEKVEGGRVMARVIADM